MNTLSTYLSKEKVFTELLPQTLANRPQLDPLTSARSLLFVEFFHQRLTESLEAKLASRQQAFRQSKSAQLRNEIIDLKNLIQNLNEFNGIAVSSCLTTPPQVASDQFDTPLESIFINEATKFALELDQLPGNEYHAELFASYIDQLNIGFDLKQELKTEVLKLGVIASHAIGGKEDNEYEIAESAEQRATKLKQDIATHRSRVKSSMTLEQCPQELPNATLLSPMRVILSTAVISMARNFLPEALFSRSTEVLIGATILDKMYGYICPRVRGADGLPSQSFSPKRFALVTATATAIALYTPQIVGESMGAMTEFFKAYSFLPFNTIIKVTGALVLAEEVGKRLGTAVKERNYTRLAIAGAAGALALMMYQADSVGIIGNSLTSLSQIYQSNRWTQLVTIILFSTLLSRNEGESIKRGVLIGGIAYLAGSLPLGNYLDAGQGVVRRVLPEQIAPKINLPISYAAQVSTNLLNVKVGETLGEIPGHLLYTLLRNLVKLCAGYSPISSVRW